MRYQPLPSSVFTTNRERLAEILPHGALAILNANDIMPTNADGTMGFRQNSDLFYLSGVDQEETVLLLFPTASDPKHREMLFVRETNEHLAIWEGDKLTKERAREVSGIEHVHWLTDLPRLLRDCAMEAQSLYLNANEHLRADVTVQTRDRRFIEHIKIDFPLHPLGRLSPLLYKLRMTKSKEELDAIRQATKITKDGFERVMRFVQPGVTEYEVEAEYVHEFIRGGSRGFAYPPIIATGFNACVLHYVQNEATCQDGELLLLDVAAEYGNYHSDLTRTIPVNGRFTERQKDVYNAVLRVLKATSAMLVPGALPLDVQKATEKLMETELLGLGLINAEEIAAQNPDKPALKKYFMHGVSHHIGLDVHDVHQFNAPLQPNMVLTVEPGIYIREEKLAVRLENIVVVGENPENLMSEIPLEIEDIEAHMAS